MMENDPGGTSTSKAVAKPVSANTSVIPKSANSTGKLQDNEKDMFSKQPARLATHQDFRSTPKYNDQESFVNQRQHSVGLGLYFTDEINDLPPRHREKVRKVYQKVVEYANAVIPANAIATSHGGPIQISDLLQLEAPKNLTEALPKVEDRRNYNQNHSELDQRYDKQKPNVYSNTSNIQRTERNCEEYRSSVGDISSSETDIKSKVHSIKSKNSQPKPGWKSDRTETNRTKEAGDNCSENFSGDYKSPVKHSQEVSSQPRSVKNQKLGNKNSEFNSSNSKFDWQTVKDSDDSLKSEKGKLVGSAKSWQNRVDSQPRHEAKSYECSENIDRSPCKSEASVRKYSPKSSESHKGDYSKSNAVEKASSVKDFKNRGLHAQENKVSSENHNATNKHENVSRSSNGSRSRTFSSISNDDSTQKSNSQEKTLSRKKFHGSSSSEKYSANDEYNEQISRISHVSKFRKGRGSLDGFDNVSDSKESDSNPMASMSFNKKTNNATDRPKKSAFNICDTDFEGKTKLTEFQNTKLKGGWKPDRTDSFRTKDPNDNLSECSNYDLKPPVKSSQDVSSQRKTGWKSNRTDPHRTKEPDDNFSECSNSVSSSQQNMGWKSNKTDSHRTKEPDDNFSNCSNSMSSSQRKPGWKSNRTDSHRARESDDNLSECSNSDHKSSVKSSQSQRKNGMLNQKWGNKNSERASVNTTSNSKFKQTTEHENENLKYPHEDRHVISAKSFQNKKSSYPQQEASSNKKCNENSDRSPSKSETSGGKYGRQSSVLLKGDYSEFTRADDSASSLKDFQNRGTHALKKNVSSENYNRNKKNESVARSLNSRNRNRTFSSTSSDNFELKSDFREKTSGKKFLGSSASEKYSAIDNCNKKESRISEDSNFRKSKHSLADFSNASNSRESLKSIPSINMDRKTTHDENRQKKFLLNSTDPSVMQHVVNAAYSELELKKVQRLNPRKEMKKLTDHGFFVRVNVSENSSKLEFWDEFFKKELKQEDFSLDYCCKFTEVLILNFQSKEAAYKAFYNLKKAKKRAKDLREAHIISVYNVKTRLTRPCNCESNMVVDCRKHFEEFSYKYVREHRQKMAEIQDELDSLRNSRGKFSREHRSNLEDALSTLETMETVFHQQYEKLTAELYKNEENCESNIILIRQLKKNFSRECNSFQRCLPIYSKKDKIIEMVRFHPVSVVIADTGSGKSTQLAEYLLPLQFEDSGTIICTQPRKIAAISITNYVCGQIGCPVGKLVGYDVGIEKKYDKDTKIIYMTDYAFLKKCLRNRKLRGVSCVIIDEAHERTLYTDLLLGLIKECLKENQSLRVVITSATIDPTVFVNFFNLSPQNAIIRVPGRTYPVEEIWLENTVEIGWPYVERCVKTAVKIHLEEEKGDILVFLTSPSEIDESILMFKELCPEFNTPLLLSLHGKTDLQEQMLIFKTTNVNDRKVIFATNAAETSLTIPGIRYVIDSGMAKELVYFPEKNKSCLMITFINKSSAEQRKGRAGRTQPGVCFRMYSKENFENMPERSCPEMLKTNLQRALLKICEFGIQPEKFDFVESPPKETIARSLDSLEQLDLIKNNKLTKTGEKVVKLPSDPRLSKLVLLGVEAKIGYEVAIIAALAAEAGRLFLRFKDIQVEADIKKKQFCQKSGDLCTFLEVYKRWMEISKPERYDWCVSNYINSRALNSAAKTVQEILVCLYQELSLRVIRRYNNAAFKAQFESIVFNCFSENLCTYSGHPKLGYSSPYLKESLYMHPSSALSYLGKELPEFLVYNTLLQTSRNFLMDVTPIKRETLDKAYQKGTFKLQVDMMKCLQISPKVLGPFGESVLIRHIIGKAGSKIVNLELIVEKLINSRNFKIDVCVDKGIIVIFLEKRFHDRVSDHIYDIVNQVHSSMAKEEDIVKMSCGFSYFCLGAGGRISDIIMPGEFRELIVDSLRKTLLNKVETSLCSFGDLQSFRVTDLNSTFCKVNATYWKVLDAKAAMRALSKQSAFIVKSHVYVQESGEKSLPLYRLQVSWCRSPSNGSGWVEFFSDADCILASGRLTNAFLRIGNNPIHFTPSDVSTKELEMSNLPGIVNEDMIRERIVEVLNDFVRVKSIYIRRRKVPPVTEKDVTEVKKQLNQTFSRFTPSRKLVIEVTYPNARSNMWTAMAYFESKEDGERALREVQGQVSINSFPAEVKPIVETRLVCKKRVFESVEEEIAILQCKKGTKITVEPMADSAMVSINFTCKKSDELSFLRQRVVQLLQGVTIQCFGRKEFSYLFTVNGERFIESIQDKTKTLISLDSLRKTITIYGSKSNCNEAELLIRSSVNNRKKSSENKRVFDLKNSCIPSGFLKTLYEKYGLDLFGLVKEFNLEDVNIDVKKGSFALYGSKKQLKLVEDCLEKICSDLHDGAKPSDLESDKETCGICLDPIPYDYYRLENCGHAFCKSCLLLQVKSKTLPVVCVQENCGKDLFLMDIKRILTLGGDSVKRSFYHAALQYHVHSNIGKISYCPSPDCEMVYRVASSDGEFHCPGCDVDICTRCQSPYHYGMTCDMFQNCVNDEDYSLKVWMQENESLRKQCPHCKIVIEKNSGCNHMECFNCHSDFCWLCLELFPNGDLVYDHMPYCPKNQTSSS